MTVKDSIKAFAAAVRTDRAANPGIAGDGVALELLIAPHFKALLEAILPEVTAMPPAVLPEYARRGVGRPDIGFAQPESSARAFIELKEPGKPLDPALFRGHDADQFARFSELPVWALSNFLGIRLYQRGELIDAAEIVPTAALEPDTSDAAAARLIDAVDHEGFLRILQTLATAQPHAPRDPEEVALVLAHAARLVRSVVLAQCREGLGPVASDVRADFNETLFARAEAGGRLSRPLCCILPLGALAAVRGRRRSGSGRTWLHHQPRLSGWSRIWWSPQDAARAFRSNTDH